GRRRRPGRRASPRPRAPANLRETVSCRCSVDRRVGRCGMPSRPSIRGSSGCERLHYAPMPAHHLIDLATPVEKAFLVAVDTGTEDGWTAQDSLAELANLATTAGAEVVGAERETGFDVLIADDELSPAQQRALEELLNVKVIDRSRLILDIFALHAQ